MRNLLCTILATASLTVGFPPAAGADPRAPLADAIASAAQVRIDALDITDRLRGKRPDMAALLQRLSVLQERVTQLQQSMGGVEIDEMSLVPADREALQRARAASDALAALLQNKAALLNDPERAARERTLIRAKAQGIAKRAELIEDQLSKVLGH